MGPELGRSDRIRRCSAPRDGVGEVSDDIEFRCKDDPEANGRVPKIGEQRFTLLFPLEDGRNLRLHMGREGMNYFETFIAQMMVDDHDAEEKK